jgi:hypothetical protein
MTSVTWVPSIDFPQTLSASFNRQTPSGSAHTTNHPPLPLPLILVSTTVVGEPAGFASSHPTGVLLFYPTGVATAS